MKSMLRAPGQPQGTPLRYSRREVGATLVVALYCLPFGDGGLLMDMGPFLDLNHFAGLG